jgi:hypothetical protein
MEITVQHSELTIKASDFMANILFWNTKWFSDAELVNDCALVMCSTLFSDWHNYGYLIQLVPEEKILSENHFQCCLLNCKNVNDVHTQGHDDQTFVLYVTRENIHAEMMTSFVYILLEGQLCRT